MKLSLQRKCAVCAFSLSLFVTVPSHAFFGDGGAGWAQLPYLIKILEENIRRYQQLRSVIKDARQHRRWLKDIHQGLENASALLESLPVKQMRSLVLDECP